jgi:hypothetical protein
MSCQKEREDGCRFWDRSIMGRILVKPLRVMDGLQIGCGGRTCESKRRTVNCQKVEFQNLKCLSEKRSASTKTGKMCSMMPLNGQHGLEAGCDLTWPSVVRRKFSRLLCVHDKQTNSTLLLRTCNLLTNSSQLRGLIARKSGARENSIDTGKHWKSRLYASKAF